MRQRHRPAQAATHFLLNLLLLSQLAACGDSAESSSGAPGNEAPPGLDEPAASPDGSARLLDDGESVGFSPFVMTHHDPLSTFAADVDSASYDIFRQLALAGSKPQPEQVRLEEYLNSFDYAYDFPSETERFRVAMELHTSPLYSGTPMLRIGLQAPKAEEFIKRPANLVFVVDVSGSMATERKLPLVKEMLKRAISALDPSDKISIVTYAGQAGVRLEPTPVAQREMIEEALDELEAGGGTAGASGLELAYEQAESAFISGGINHVVICTDGDFNIGPSSTDEMVELIVRKRESGITLTVAGFGAGLNDAMMEAISNKGNGTYAVIYNEERAQSYVQEDMLATLQHIAKDVKIQVEFNPELILAYRRLGYDNRQLVDEDFRNDVIDAGEIGAGHQVTALYQLVTGDTEVPSPQGAPDPVDGDSAPAPDFEENELVRVRVRYKEPDAGATDEATEITATLVAAESEEVATDDFRWTVGVAALAERLAGVPFADEAIAPLIQTRLEAASDDSEQRSELIGLLPVALK